LLGTVVQVVIDIIADAVCLVIETRRGQQQPLAACRELPRAALAPIVTFALVYATYVAERERAVQNPVR
jgi:hypothetical protein